MFCQTPTTIDGKRHSLSPGGGMILPSTNQEEIVKGFLSELTFWGDLPMAAESQHDNRDELTRIKVQRDTISDSCESRRSQTLKEVSKSPMNTGSVWRTAVDPHSGRTYYYDAISRRTQWDKVRSKIFERAIVVNTVEAVPAGEVRSGRLWTAVS